MRAMIFDEANGLLFRCINGFSWKRLRWLTEKLHQLSKEIVIYEESGEIVAQQELNIEAWSITR